MLLGYLEEQNNLISSVLKNSKQCNCILMWCLKTQKWEVLV